MAAAMSADIVHDPYVMGEDFDRWRKKLEMHFTARAITDPDQKRAWLLLKIGDLSDVYDTFSAPTSTEGDTYTQCVAQLSAYISPTRSVIGERVTFHRINQDEEEPFDLFLGRLRVQGRRCGFSAAELERELRDRCVAGSCRKLQKRLLTKAAEKGDALTLADVKSAAQVFESTRKLDSQLHQPRPTSAPAEAEVQAVYARRKTDSARPSTQRGGQRGGARGFSGACYFCKERGHMRAHCPRNKALKCFRCGGPHMKRDCHQTVRAVDEEEVEELQCDSVSEDLWAVEEKSELDHSWVGRKAHTTTLEVNGSRLDFVIDSGSPVTIVSRNTAVPGLHLRPTSLTLKSYTGQRIPLIGEADVEVDQQGRKTKLRLLVSKLDRKPLMGREWMDQLEVDTQVSPASQVGLLQGSLEHVLEKHDAVFQGGKTMSVTARLQLRPGARPVCKPARQVPFALRQAVEQELDRWLEESIAEKVEPSANSGWGTPLVPIPKGQGVRLAADYRITVNPQLLPQTHPTPTPEEVFAGVRGKVFARLDLKNAYQQMELEPDSKDMTTVTTHRGKLRMNRLPFGISQCCGIFQAAIDQILDGIDGCIAYLDDLLVTGRDEADLVARLDEVLTRLEQHGVQLKREKCAFNLREVEYLGWLVSADSLRAVPDKLDAVRQLPQPTTVSELRSVLGAINYYQKLLPGLASKLAPLYKLLKKGAPWDWTTECREAMEQVTRMMASNRVLMRYDPDLPLKLITDASSVGVGATLVHVADGMERPICYASRTLTETEKKYAMVEKEAVGVSFGITRFHQYLYGRSFCLVTDNRALSYILNPSRELPNLAAARMQRYALQLAAYSYTVEWRKSQAMGITDVMSRMPKNRAAETQDEEVGCIQQWGGEGPALTAKELETATRRDVSLGKVLTYVRAGWPSSVEADLRAFSSRANELSTDGDCLLWGGRVVVPLKLQERVLQELHTGHVGGGKMKQLARRYFWWPGLDAELEILARTCEACVEKRSAPPRASLHPWEPTMGPMERINIDFAGPIQGSMLLVVVDSYSKWIEVIPMKTTTAGRTVEELRTLFARLGIPKQVVSDNGPQFTSGEVAEFFRNNGVRHIRVAPYHPSSNGAAERAVQTVKNSLKATEKDGGSLQRRLSKFLMTYRTTPHASTGKTPAESLYGRNLRTRLDLLRPDRDLQRAESQEQMAANVGGTPRAFSCGQEIWVRSYTGPKWRRGLVAARTGPLSYEVDVGDACWSRHADQLLASAPARDAPPAATPRQMPPLVSGATSDTAATTAEPAPTPRRTRSRAEGASSGAEGPSTGADTGPGGLGSPTGAGYEQPTVQSGTTPVKQLPPQQPRGLLSPAADTPSRVSASGTTSRAQPMNSPAVANPEGPRRSMRMRMPPDWLEL